MGRLYRRGQIYWAKKADFGHESINTTTMYAHISTPLRTATVARLLEEAAP